MSVINKVNRPHVIPVSRDGGEPFHTVSLRCPCHPFDSTSEGVVIHHAFDGREKLERQGIRNPDKRWVIVLEDTNP